MLKRFAALFLSLILVLSLFGCATQPREKDAVDEFLEQKTEETTEFVAYNKKKETMSEEPLRILMDLEYVGREPLDASVVLNEFLNTLEQSGGLTDVVIEYVPKHGEDRENMLERIHEEIAYGVGPDVFIVNCGGGASFPRSDVPQLFPFPEKAMEDGVFLPLDEYMENNTVYTEWDKQTQSVLAAGRNYDGQQIIPLTYIFPVLCYSTEDVPEFPAEEDATWMDIVNDPMLSELARPMYDCINIFYDQGMYYPGVTVGYPEYIFGDLANYPEMQLEITEEEIFQRVKEIFELCDRTMGTASNGVEKYPYALPWLGRDLSENFGVLIKEPIGSDGSHESFGNTEPLTLIPIYSDDGGVNASIMSFAAINRNTQKPEEAYMVIDLLMRDVVQRKYTIYSEFLTAGGTGISMHEDLMLKETSVGGRGQWYMIPQRYEEVCKIRDRITTANFKTALDTAVYEMVIDCMMVYFDEGSDEEVKEVISVYYERMEQLIRE